jgi:prepilin-type N-terminal cleavage/methylation domain-containing protein
MKTKKGFTLVELLVVIAIIALLLSILVPALSRARETAKRTICGSQIKQVGLAVVAYANDYDDALPFYGGKDPSWSGDFAGGPSDELHPYAVLRNDKPPWMGPPPVPMKLGCLFAGNYIAEGKLFYCPSNRDLSFMYKSYIVPTGSNTSTKWLTLPQAYNAATGKNDWVRVGYGYYPIDKDIRNVPPWRGMTRQQGRYFPIVTPRKFSKVTSLSPYLTDVIWSKEDISHRSGMSTVNGKVVLANAGINALFKDGHVVYRSDGPVIVDGRSCKFFDNPYWDDWERSVNDKMDAGFLFYNIFTLIQP